MWDPDVYLTFADHRGRPFADLLSRVRAIADQGLGQPTETGERGDDGGNPPIVVPALFRRGYPGNVLRAKHHRSAGDEALPG